jgi:Putative ABC-transporter type IV
MGRSDPYESEADLARAGRAAAPRGRVRQGQVLRFLAYGLLGLGTELTYTGVVRGRPRTSIWMLLVYGLAQPLFEPAHERLRARPLPVRAAVYGLGFTAVEYASGRALRRLRGTAPWDYGRARVNVDGLVRADYVPLWAGYGLFLERVHDALARNRHRVDTKPRAFSG